MHIRIGTTENSSRVFFYIPFPFLFLILSHLQHFRQVTGENGIKNKIYIVWDLHIQELSLTGRSDFWQGNKPVPIILGLGQAVWYLSDSSFPFGHPAHSAPFPLRLTLYQSVFYHSLIHLASPNIGFLPKSHFPTHPWTFLRVLLSLLEVFKLLFMSSMPVKLTYQEKQGIDGLILVFLHLHVSSSPTWGI